MMDAQVEEKVYVALGSDLEDGFKTLEWTLKKWQSNPISVVILHVTYNICEDFVYTPFGKLPASSVSEQKLDVLRKYEQEKIDKLLSKYIAFCGKVKAEILKVEKSDEPVYKFVTDLISRYRITRLVMGITFMKSSSWRSKSAISGLFYIHQNKPCYCEFYIVCGGKLIILKQNEGAFIEEDEGPIAAKRVHFKKWIPRIFRENSPNSPGKHPHHNVDSPNSRNQWESNVKELEDYFEHLLSLDLDEEVHDQEQSDIFQGGTVVEPDLPEQSDFIAVSRSEKMEMMKSKIEEAQKFILSKREEAEANAERCTKAEWAICLCNGRVEELEAKINKEVTKRTEIKSSLDAEKEQIQEILGDVKESKNRLSSLAELQSELSNKLQLSTLARSHAEAQLEKAVVARAEMVREIEELRRQRDVLQRRIEFCKEKDAIGIVTKIGELSCGYREYTSEDIRSATDDFSENRSMKSGGDWTNVYRGCIHHAMVAIKMINSDSGLSQEAFLAKVKLLNDIRHPNLVAMMGFCLEPMCIIFEYMHTGSLRDILFSSHRSHRRGSRALRWQDRVRIAHEVCSGLCYLHSAQPRPIVHGRLTTSNILLDRNLVAKICGFGLSGRSVQQDVRSDVRAFGVLLLHLLTGRNWAGLVEGAMAVNRTALVRVLDETAGQWPLDLVEELVRIAVRCLSINQEPNRNMSMATVAEELDEIRRKAGDIAGGRGGYNAIISNEGADQEDSGEVPRIFLCPIFQDVMKNPHVAADGFSYELEAIEEWLKMGRDTSPMTNLTLKHKYLTPNFTLRRLIQDWHSKNPVATS